MTEEKKQDQLSLERQKSEATPIKFLKKDNETKLDVEFKGQRDEVSNANKGRLLREKLKEITGVKDDDLACHILDTAANSLSPFVGKPEHLNTLLQSLHDLKPHDAIEAQLGAKATVLFSHGMAFLKNAATAEFLNHAESYTNRAIKLLRVHNETIETLNRYRRGGEQKVTVTHAVVAGQAIVNNFNGVGGSPKFQGENPCQQENAVPKPEQTIIDHAVNPQCQTADADSTAESVQVLRRKKGKVG